MIARAKDLTGDTPGDIVAKCNDNIEKSMSVLSASPENNGNPLLFAYASGKPHILDGSRPKSFRTAATDGSRFYWYPQFLAALSGLQTVTITKHENYHNLLLHPEQMRSVQYPKAFNIAADLLVNAMIEREWAASDYGNSYVSEDNHPLWSPPLGKPITLAELKEVFMEDKDELLENYKKKVEEIKKRRKLRELEERSGRRHNCKEADEKERQKIEEDSKKFDPNDVNLKYTLVDKSLLGRSALDIYKEIKEWYKDLDEDLQDLLGEFLSDEHMPGDRSEEDAIKELLKAAGFAKNMRGNMPGEVEALLKELSDPTIDLTEFIDQSIKKTLRDGGCKASYTKFKRRFLGEEIYFPRYMRAIPQILVLLDTSGSMSDDDIAVGVSQVQQFIGKADLYIVPTDAAPHWDATSKVTKLSDFKRVDIKGRGGTVFDDFFKNYRYELRRFGHFDSIIVISDGYVGKVPREYTPPCDVGWVMTSPAEFDQYFGKPIYLQRAS